MCYVCLFAVRSQNTMSLSMKCSIVYEWQGVLYSCKKKETKSWWVSAQWLCFLFNNWMVSTKNRYQIWDNMGFVVFSQPEALNKFQSRRNSQTRTQDWIFDLGSFLECHFQPLRSPPWMRWFCIRTPVGLQVYQIQFKTPTFERFTKGMPHNP